MGLENLCEFFCSMFFLACFCSLMSCFFFWEWILAFSFFFSPRVAVTTWYFQSTSQARPPQVGRLLCRLQMYHLEGGRIPYAFSCHKVVWFHQTPWGGPGWPGLVGLVGLHALHCPPEDVAGGLEVVEAAGWVGVHPLAEEALVFQVFFFRNCQKCWCLHSAQPLPSDPKAPAWSWWLPDGPGDGLGHWALAPASPLTSSAAAW